MRLFTCTGAPSPRRVTWFLAEKDIQLEQVEVDLRAGEHMTDGFALRSPECTVPVLELDDGSCLWNTLAIRQYLESLQPEPLLLGRDARECAEVLQWSMWIEHNGFLAAAEAFRNAAPGMKDHAVPGRRPVAQIDALAERGRLRFGHFLSDLEQRLSDREYIAADHFTTADIDAVTVLDFGLRATRGSLDEFEQLRTWREAIAARPAFEA